jgi:hypothetical protein
MLEDSKSNILYKLFANKISVCKQYTHCLYVVYMYLDSDYNLLCISKPDDRPSKAPRQGPLVSRVQEGLYNAGGAEPLHRAEHKKDSPKATASSAKRPEAGCSVLMISAHRSHNKGGYAAAPAVLHLELHVPSSRKYRSWPSITACT